MVFIKCGSDGPHFYFLPQISQISADQRDPREILI